MGRRDWRRWAVGAGVAAGVAAMVATTVSTAGALSTYQVVRANGFVASSPALAATADNEQFIAVRGSDDGIYIARNIFNGAEWTDWEPLGAPPGGAKGDPALVSARPGELALFVRGADSKLWVRTRVATGVWGSWLQPVGDDGTLKSSPRATSRAPGRIDVFVIGTDDRVYQRFLNGLWNTSWIPLDEPEGSVGLVGDPAAASLDENHVYLFARGTDNRLWAKYWTGSVWTAWGLAVPDGVLNSSPAAVPSGLGGLVVFVRGTDQNLYSNELGANAVWRGWRIESLTGNNPFQDSPSAALRPSGHLDAAVRGINNLAYTEVYRF